MDAPLGCAVGKVGKCGSVVVVGHGEVGARKTEGFDGVGGFFQDLGHLLLYFIIFLLTFKIYNVILN